MQSKKILRSREEETESKLKEVYGERKNLMKKYQLDDTQLLEMAGNLRDGVPMATPVFDGAHEIDINELLTKAGVSTSGQ
jgi:DNA-directed RNA polymerase subunit beta